MNYYKVEIDGNDYYFHGAIVDVSKFTYKKFGNSVHMKLIDRKNISIDVKIEECLPIIEPKQVNTNPSNPPKLENIFQESSIKAVENAIKYLQEHKKPYDPIANIDNYIFHQNLAKKESDLTIYKNLRALHNVSKEEAIKSAIERIFQ